MNPREFSLQKRFLPLWHQAISKLVRSYSPGGRALGLCPLCTTADQVLDSYIEEYGTTSSSRKCYFCPWLIFYHRRCQGYVEEHFPGVWGVSDLRRIRPLNWRHSSLKRLAGWQERLRKHEQALDVRAKRRKKWKRQ